jgi:hypothetical protein
MKNPTPLRCAYCEAVSNWSSEPADSQELSSPQECPRCGGSSPLWADSTSHQLDDTTSMRWVATGPFP